MLLYLYESLTIDNLIYAFERSGTVAICCADTKTALLRAE